MLHKKMHVSILTFMLFLFPVVNLYAQDTKTLTLKEAVELSIKNSKQLQLSKARIDEAVAATKEATQRRTPDVNVSANYLRLNSANVKLAGTGDSSSKSPININQVLYGTANINYPIFAGFKIKFGIESAHNLEKAATLDADNDKQEVILNTISAYVNLYKANIAARLMEENLAQSRQRDTDFANLEKNGLLARNDLLKAELQTSQFELNLLDAQNAIELADVNMNLMLGLPESTKLVIDSTSLQQTGEVKTIEEYEQLATQNRFDVQALANRKKAADDAIKIAKGDYYPSIGISGGYAAVDVPKFLTVTNAINVGIGVKYSLSSLWKTDTKVQQAKARAQQFEANEAMLSDEIHLSVNKAYEDYFSGLKKIEVFNKEVEQSSENYRISKNKYNNSLLTLTDLLEADVSQLSAKLNLSLAKADVYLSYETLLQKAGLLNEQLILK
jgi:outer membrane protein